MNLWCVVCYEHGGGDSGFSVPRFFTSKEDAGKYIHREVTKEVNDLGDFPESYISENYIDCIRAEISNYDFSIVWECFDVGDDVEKILKTEA